MTAGSHKLFRSLTKSDLLILDDWGPDRLTAPQRRDLMEIVEDRYGRGSTLITSQLPVDKWHDVIDEPTFADAILDRLVHNAYRLALAGPSLRNPEAAEAEPASVDARCGDQQDDDAQQASQGSQEMNVVPSIPPAPVGQQGPPARAAASDSWRSLRSARGPLLLTTGTGSVALDLTSQH